MFVRKGLMLSTGRSAALAAVLVSGLVAATPSMASAGATDFSAARRHHHYRHHHHGGGAAAAAAFAGIVGTIGAIAAAQASRDAYYDGPYAYYGGPYYAPPPPYYGYGGFYGGYDYGRRIDPGGNIIPR